MRLTVPIQGAILRLAEEITRTVEPVLMIRLLVGYVFATERRLCVSAPLIGREPGRKRNFTTMNRKNLKLGEKPWLEISSASTDRPA
jgi:hypothetical protein